MSSSPMPAMTRLGLDSAASPVPETTPETALTPACKEPLAPLRKRQREASPAGKSVRARALVGYRSAGIRNPIHEVMGGLKERANPDKPFVCLANGDPAVHPHLRPSESMLAAVDAALGSGAEAGQGLSDCRRAVAESFSVPGRPALEAKDVFVSLGCSEALSHCIEALAAEGGNMLLPRPCFPLYEVLCRYHGLEVRHYDLLADEGWQIDVASLAAVKDKNTVAVFLNNPSNPTGAVYSREHLEEVLQAVERLGLPVIADEVFGGLSFKEPFYPCAAVSASVPVLAVSALAKRWLAPGWRIGWVTVHDAKGFFRAAGVHGALERLCQISGPSGPLAAAVPAILSSTPALWSKSAVWSLERSAEACVRRAARVPGLSIASEPGGSMYLMVRIEPGALRGVGQDDVAFARQLLEEESVAVLPGHCFGAPGFFRIVFAATPSVLEHAWDRIEAFCRRRGQPL